MLGQKSDLAEDDVAGAHHQQVALEAATDLLLNAVVHVRRVVGVTLVDEDLLRQLDGQAVPVYGDFLHQLSTFYPHWVKEREERVRCDAHGQALGVE